MRGRDYFHLPTLPALWTWWLGLGLNAAGILLLGIPFVVAAYGFTPLDWQLSAGEGLRGGYAYHLALFASFVPAFLVPLLLWRFLNGLPVRRLVSWTGRVRWGHVLRAGFVVMVAYSAFCALEYRIDPDAYAGLQRQTDWTGYAVLLAITLLLCPVQASSEELLVRGYANHALVRTFARLRIGPGAAVWTAYILTSALFASLHLGNPEGDGQIGPYMAGTFVFGMGMCVLLHFEGGLESAIGYHIANNLFVFSLLGYSDPELPDSALFWVPEIVIGWTDIFWDTLWTAALVAVILWWNRKAEGKADRNPSTDRR
ncbi:MAG: lysostaphin resistance A-like protein [Litorimonas sp.]